MFIIIVALQQFCFFKLPQYLLINAKEGHFTWPSEKRIAQGYRT